MYQEAKRVKQGLQTIDQRFEPLASWISQEYSVSVLHISRKFQRHSKKLSLYIYLNSNEDKTTLYQGGQDWKEKDVDKETAIAHKYIELASKQKPVINLQFHTIFNRLPIRDDIYVVYFSLEESAVSEANESIPREKIDTLQRAFADNRIWLFSRCFYSTTLFVFTDEQKAELKKEAIFKTIEDSYFDLLKQYDEFNYWTRHRFGLHIQSKETLDRNHEGSFFYYYR
ncbi:hypothetical protein GCM10023185_17900 [Hymenobacter saemangeumensis]|uniref:Uncharacterized protein n=2 Tax=Hymenobacter saemangeumensis TaxID=1084522 RepID=A0ABP8IB54_9BACT